MDNLEILENIQLQIVEIADVLKDTLNADIKEMLEARLTAYLSLEISIMEFIKRNIEPVITCYQQ